MWWGPAVWDNYHHSMPANPFEKSRIFRFSGFLGPKNSKYSDVPRFESSRIACVEWLHDWAANLYSLFGTDSLRIASYSLCDGGRLCEIIIIIGLLNALSYRAQQLYMVLNERHSKLKSREASWRKKTAKKKNILVSLWPAPKTEILNFLN